MNLSLVLVVSSLFAQFPEPRTAVVPSDFAVWWNAQRSRGFSRTLSARICTVKAAPNAAFIEDTNQTLIVRRQAWCGTHLDTEGVNVLAALESPGLALAIWQLDPLLLLTPLRQLAEIEAADLATQQAAARARLSLPSQSQELNAELNRLTTSLEGLKTIAQAGSVNADGATASAAAGVLPGVDLEAILDRVLDGLAKAIETRGEQEATAYVLGEVQQKLCGDKSPLKTWLKATCAAAAAQAFGGGPGSGGLGALVLLKKALEADVRAIPGNVLRLLVLLRAPGAWLPVANGLADFINDVLSGVHPAQAAERFGKRVISEAATLGADGLKAAGERLRVATADLQATPEWKAANDASTNAQNVLAATPNDAQAKQAVEAARKALEQVELPLGPLKLELDRWTTAVAPSSAAPRQALACLATFPAAFERAAQSATSAATGTNLREEDKALAALVLALTSSSCLEGMPLADQLKLVQQQLPALSKVARSVASLIESTVAMAKKPLAPDATLTEVAARASTQLLAVIDLGEAAVALLKVIPGTPPEASKELGEGLLIARQLQALASATAARDVTAVFEQLMLHLGESCAMQPCLPVPKELLTWGGLIVTIADAKTAEEVKTAVLAAATPAGTWRTKLIPEANPVISLGGFLGFGPRYQFEAGWQPRVQVPFGADISFGVGRAISFGVFIQLLDLAGYSTYAQAGLPAPRPLQALSPGVSLRMSLGPSPFWLMTGFGYDVDAGRATPGGLWWWSAGLGVDATLFLLHRN